MSHFSVLTLDRSVTPAYTVIIHTPGFSCTPSFCIIFGFLLYMRDVLLISVAREING